MDLIVERGRRAPGGHVERAVPTMVPRTAVLSATGGEARGPGGSCSLVAGLRARAYLRRPSAKYTALPPGVR